MTKDTTTETAALKALLSETCDHQILAGMPGFVADRLMALDVDQLCGAGANERSTGRVRAQHCHLLPSDAGLPQISSASRDLPAIGRV